MTIRHHPSAELMLDYAAGGLAHAPSLAIATHLSLCPRCRRETQRLEALGGRLMSDTPGSRVVRDTTLDAVLSKITAAEDEQAPALQPATAVFPHPLRVALGGDIDSVPWKRLGMGAYHYIIPTQGAEAGATARLLLIPAGRPVPVHTHVGRELTLTLCGSYADATGRFMRGDLQDADDALTHQPHAAPSEDCICLAVTEAPLRFKSWPARLLQPLLGI